MVSVYDVDATELIERAAQELKKDSNIKAPSWAVFVKTGINRERPPLRQDWWYMRAASILRKLYVFSPVGVNSLRRVYGGRKNRGDKPDKVKRASGNIIRKILQQLEKAGLAAKTQKGIHKGRTVSAKGKSLLDKISTQLYKEAQKKKQQDEEIEKMEENKVAEQKKVMQEQQKAQALQQKQQIQQQKPIPQKPIAQSAPQQQKPVAQFTPHPQKPISQAAQQPQKPAAAIPQQKPEIQKQQAQ